MALSTLAEQINAEHRQAVAALNNGLEHAHRGGELLRQAKAKCPHGGFSEWLRKNFEGSERTAQMYMQIAKRWPQIEEAKAQRIALLTYSGAIKLLTAPKPARKAELKKLERLEGSELRNVVVATGSLVNVAEKPRPAPKPGQIKADGRLWKRWNPASDVPSIAATNCIANSPTPTCTAASWDRSRWLWTPSPNGNVPRG